MITEDQPLRPATLVQQAIGNYIAQAAQGGTATVNVYQFVASRTGDEAALRAGEDLLATIPRDQVPAIGPLPSGSRVLLRPNPLFTGRLAELVRLAALAVPINGTVAVAGIGGVGKTQLVVEFVHRFGRFFAGGVQWLSFADPGNVPAEIAACGDSMASRPDLHTLPLDRRVEAVLAEWQQPLPRLLIFDNCDDENLLATWRPTTGGARVLVTSRRRDWDPALGVDVVPVDVLSRPESVELIGRFRPDIDSADPHLAGIADELGGLPLALHLAGNYLRAYRHIGLGDPATYHSVLAGPDVLTHPSLIGEVERFSPTGHERHVADTFAISFNQITGAEDAIARRVLVALATMAPGEPVPNELLHRAVDDKAASTSAAAGTVELTLGRLEALGLVTRGIAGEPRMHRLIVAYVGTMADEPTARQAAQGALFEWGRQAFVRGNTRALAAAEPHLRWVADHALRTRDMEAASWANLVGNCLNDLGDYTGAHSYLEDSCVIAEELLGPTNSALALYLNDLGHSLLNLQENAKAIPYFERAIPLWEQSADLPNLAATLDNLGQAMVHLQQDGRPALERALAIRTKVLGADDPRTATTLHSLGRHYQKRGQFQEAKRNFDEALRIRMAKGEEAKAANTLTALGSLYIDAGELSDARANLERALSIRRRELGINHPRTRNTQRLLMVVHLGLGNIAEAAAYSPELTDEEPRIGTADDWNTAGYLSWVLGDHREALRWYAGALAVVKDRPANTDYLPQRTSAQLSEALILNNVGMAQVGLEEFAEAERLFRQALAATHDLGLRARIRNNLGVALIGLARYGEAERMLTDALAERRSLHGDIHRDVAATIDNIGRMFLSAGDLPAAVKHLGRAHDMLTQHFPSSRVEIAKSLHNLGCLAAAQHDETHARRCFDAALQIRIEHLPRHPDTAATLVCLGELGSALEIYELRLGPNHPRTRALRIDLATRSEEMAP